MKQSTVQSLSSTTKNKIKSIAGRTYKSASAKADKLWESKFRLWTMSKSLLVGLLILLGLSKANAQFTAGRIVVLRTIGSTSKAPSQAVLKEYTTTGTAGITVSIDSSTATHTPFLTAGVYGGSEACLTTSADGTFLVVAGYGTYTTTADITGTSSSTVKRVVGKINVAGTYATMDSSATFFNGNDNRVAVSDGTNFWAGGAAIASTDGIDYFGPGSQTQLATDASNPPKAYGMRIFNNQIYYSTQKAGPNNTSSHLGIFSLSNGEPTSGTQTVSNIIIDVTSPSGQSNAVPMDFSFSPDGKTCYIAINVNTTGVGGIQKWTSTTAWASSGWNYQYTLATGSTSNTSGAYGLVVDYSGGAGNYIIYATTFESAGNRIVKFTDTGGSATATTLVAATTGTYFKGIAFAPVAAPAIAVSPTSVTICSGGSGTTLTASCSASCTGITYLWSPGGATTSSITATSGGTYSVTATNSTGGTATATSVVTLNNTPTVSISPASAAICSGNSTTLSANCSANCTGVTYLWSPGSATTSSITVSSANTYSLTSTANSCSVTATAVVSSSSTPSTPTVTDNSNSCGSSVLATTATGTLLWNTGASTSSITVTDAGTYSVTTTVGGCPSAAGTGSAGGSFKAIPSSPTPASNGGPFCIGGTLSLSATAVSGATYSWTGPNSFTSNSLSPTVSAAATLVMAGTYSITATVGGCTSAAATTTASNFISFSDNAETGSFSTNWTAPSGGWAYNSTPSVITGTKSINNTASAGASTDYLYTSLGNIDLNNGSTTWQMNLDYYGTGPTGSANYYLYYLVADGTNLGSVQNGWGVGISNPTFGNYDLNLFKVVSGTITLAKQIGTGVNPLCNGCTGNVGVVVTRSATGVWSLQYDHTTTTFSALSSAVSYTESSPPPHAYANAYSGLYFFFNASASNFGMDNLSFMQGTPSIAVSPTSTTICSGGSGATITASCSANCTGITYIWSPGSATTSSITATTGGTYSVTATITGGCPVTVTSVVTSVTTPSAPTVTDNSNSCGSSVLATTATGTLLWSTGASTTSITVTDAGTYSVTTTVSSCTSAYGTGTAGGSFKSLPAAPTVTPNNYCGNSVLSTTATGTLLWNTTATTSSITVTASGTYSVTQTQTASPFCTSLAGTATAAPLIIPGAPLVTDVDNCGSSTLSTTATGTLSWNTGASTSAITLTAAGTYSVTTTNGSNCTSTAGTATAAPLVLTNPSPYLLSSGSWNLYSWDSSVPAGSYPGNGAVGSSTTTGVVSSPASANMVFHWMAAGTVDPILSNTPTATEDYGAAYNQSTGSRVTGLNGGSYPGFSFANTSAGHTATGCDGNLGEAVLALNTTGMSNVQVKWQAFTNNGQGNRYSLRGQYRVGNSGNYIDLPNTGASQIEYTSSGTGTSSISQYGPITLPSTCENVAVVQVRWVYYWANVSGHNSGARDEIGVDSINVSGSACAPVVTVAADTICIGGSGGTLTANCSLNCTGLTYSWSSSLGTTSSVTVNPTSNHTYTVTVTNSGNGCSTTASATVTVIPAPTVTDVDNCGTSTLSTTSTGSLLWSTGASTSSITATAAGTYSVTTTASGCTTSAGTATATPITATNPSPYVLSLGAWNLYSWDSSVPSGSYPGNGAIGTSTSTGVASSAATANMVFHWMVAGTADPTLSNTPTATENYGAAYNLSTGSRVTGLNSGGNPGFSFVNANPGHTATGCDGNLGEAVLALNTTGQSSVQVSWQAYTHTYGGIEYKLRGQYRVGNSGSYTDLPNSGTSQIEYTSSSSTNTPVKYGPITLPVTCENQAVVQVRWVYYYGGTGSGTRDEVAMDSINVSSNNYCGPVVSIAADTICAGGSGGTLTVNCSSNCTGLTYSWSSGLGTTSSVTINPSSNTTYTVTTTSSNGCSTTTTSTVTVLHTPSVTDVDNCGSSTLSTTPTGGSLLWSTGATTTSITVSTAGTYSVTESVTGCTTPAGTATAAPFLLTNPSPYLLSGGSWTLTGWRSTVAAGSYPGNGATGSDNTTGVVAGAANANMVFHWLAAGDVDPTLGQTTASEDYAYAYNVGSSSRIDGLNHGSNGGIGFINASVGHTTTGCDGNMGEAVLALNTTGMSNVQVSWIAYLAVNNQIHYKLRAQYRVGNSGSFTDLPNTGTSQIEYQSANGGSTNYGPITLPTSCENVSVIQVRWVYYFDSGTSGSRDEIGLTNITVSGSSCAPVVTVASDTTCSSGSGAVLTASCSVNCTGLTYSWSSSLGTTSSVTAYPASNHTYTVTVTNSGNGCSTTASASVTVLSAPSVTNVDNCGSSTLSATATGGSLLWSTGATTTSITVSTAGTYSVTESVTGCSTSAGTATAAPFVLTNPSPYLLSGGNWTLTGWKSSVAAGSYPGNGATGSDNTTGVVAGAANANMVFHWLAAGDVDPTLSQTIASEDYAYAYNVGSSSRVDGLGHGSNGGIGFINANVGHTATGCDGNMGEAVLALNTTGMSNVQVSWTAYLATNNQIHYKLRGQYRVGNSGSYTDLPNTGTSQIEYQSANGGSTNYGPITLPVSCENALVVQVRWVYYFDSGTSGSRDEIGLTNITVSGSACAPVVTVASDTTCSSGSGAVLTASCSVNCTGLTYSWSSSLGTTSSVTAYPTSTHSYTVTVTNSGNGCSTTASASVKVLSAPSVTDADNCGSSTLSTTATGGSLLWSTGATATSITVTAAGTYSVMQTVSGCTTSAGTAAATPVAATNPSPYALSGGAWNLYGWRSSVASGSYPANGSTGLDNTTGVASSAATANMVFHWMVAGTADPSLSSSPTATEDYGMAYNLSTGSRLTGLDGGGNKGFSFLNTNPGHTATGCDGNLGEAVLALNTTGRAGIQVSWQAYTHTYGGIEYKLRAQYRVGTGGNYTDLPNTGTSQIEYTSSSTVNTATYYGPITLPVTCENQAVVQVRWVYYYGGTGSGTRDEVAMDSISVTSGVCTPSVSISPSSTSICSGGSGATLAANCTSNCTGITYIWNTSATASAITVNPASAATYTVTATAGNGCSATATTSVTVNATPSTPSVSVTNNCGNSVLSTTATGTLLWSNSATTSAITVTASGAYTVTTTNGSGCTSAAGSGTAAPLTVPSIPSVSVTNNCGSSLLSTTATGTLLWSNSATTSAITVTASGAYTVTTTNGSGCTSAAGSGTAAPLTVPSTPSVSVTNNCGSSLLSTTATGTLLWSNSATTSAITVTASGTYTVATTNGSGCTSSAGSGTAAPLTVPSTPSVSVTNNCGSSLLSTTATGTLLWSNSATTSAITVTASGAYTVATTNGSGCTSSAGSGTAVPLTVPSTPSVSVTNNCGSSLLSTTATGTLLWSNSATTSAITVTASGAYTVTTTNGSGCTSAAGSGTAAPLTVPSAPFVSVTNNCGNSVLSTTSTGTLLWSNSATTSAITVTSSGVYTVTTTNGSGCTSAAGSGTAAPLTVPSAPSVSVTNNCSGTSILSTTATGTLAWNTGASTSAITVTASGTYSVTTTVGTCTSVAGTGAASPGNSPSGPSVSVVNNCDGSSTLSTTATGGGLLWNTGATTSSITVTAGGTYSVTQTAGSCTSAAGTGIANLASCNLTFTVKFFIQGYYMQGSGTMSPLLKLLGLSSNSTDVDTAIIELHPSSSPATVADSYKGILQSNGNLLCTFAGNDAGNSYYIVIKHRNSITTWSASGVTITSGGNYNFTTGAGQAYYSGTPATVNAGGVYCIYSGDVNQDGSINSSDRYAVQSALSSFILGSYNAYDLNGDASVDAGDYKLVRNNGALSLSVQHP